MIDLKPFCSTEKDRPGLLEPFSKGKHTYATNGHIGVRAARRKDVPERDKAPDLGALLDVWILRDGERPVDLSRLESVAKFVRCDRCRGSGFVVPCKDCNGNTSTGCGCESCHASSCKHCDDDGYLFGKKDEDDAIICEDCTGSGQEPSQKYVVVADGLGFASKYLRLITSLPNAKLYAGSREPHNPHYFTFDGGDGLLVPISLSGNEPSLQRCRHDQPT